MDHSPIKVAYFSMEIAVDPTIPTYAGGLGVHAVRYASVRRRSFSWDSKTVFNILAGVNGTGAMGPAWLAGPHSLLRANPMQSN